MKTTAASTPTDTEKIQIDAKSRLGAAFGIDLNFFSVGRGACGRRHRANTNDALSQFSPSCPSKDKVRSGTCAQEMMFFHVDVVFRETRFVQHLPRFDYTSGRHTLLIES